MSLSTSHNRFMIRISLWLSKVLDSFITVRTLVYFICNSKKFLLGSIIWHKESITSCILFVIFFYFQPLYSMTICLHSVYGTSPLGQCHCILYVCILILVSFHTYQKGREWGGGGVVKLIIQNKTLNWYLPKVSNIYFFLPSNRKNIQIIIHFMWQCVNIRLIYYCYLDLILLQMGNWCLYFLQSSPLSLWYQFCNEQNSQTANDRVHKKCS